ncbi:hypothetical protein ABK040_004460 [Willaertia magna]
MISTLPAEILTHFLFFCDDLTLLQFCSTCSLHYNYLNSKEPEFTFLWKSKATELFNKYYNLKNYSLVANDINNESNDIVNSEEKIILENNFPQFIKSNLETHNFSNWKLVYKILKQIPFESKLPQSSNEYKIFNKNLTIENISRRVWISFYSNLQLFHNQEECIDFTKNSFNVYINDFGDCHGNSWKIVIGIGMKTDYYTTKFCKDHSIAEFMEPNKGIGLTTTLTSIKAKGRTFTFPSSISKNYEIKVGDVVSVHVDFKEGNVLYFLNQKHFATIKAKDLNESDVYYPIVSVARTAKTTIYPCFEKLEIDNSITPHYL